MSLEFLQDKSWRMNHLYRIVDRDGNSIPFKLNSVQRDVLANIHNRSIILKARQVGLTTLAVLYIMDAAIFNPNLSCGIISYSLEHAQHILKSVIGHALDEMKPIAKSLCGVIQRSAKEITFKNGSKLRVDTSLRGGSYQQVLISEFGKTCARNPIKAEEVVTGTLNAISTNSSCIIESTGEGNDGYFADMVNQAHQRGNDNITKLDYKLFFYPWMLEKNYVMPHPIDYECELDKYFDEVEEETNSKISKQQRYWYVHQRSVQGDKMKQEYPSTVSEAFLSSSDAYYFQLLIHEAYKTNRCLPTPLYDAIEPVYVAMDIGVNDLTVMTFFQVIHGEIRVIDYYEDKNKGVDFYAQFLLQDKSYLYHTIFLPHDAARRDGIIVENSYQKEFQRLFRHIQTKFIVLKRTDKNINISNAKIKLSRCVFAINKVKPLLDQVSKYRKRWSEQYGKYLDEGYHDVSSHYADSFIYAMQAVTHIEAGGIIMDSLQKHRQAVQNRANKI